MSESRHTAWDRGALPRREMLRGRESAIVALSPRQAEVIGLIAWGFTDAEIAQELGITHRTVRAHCDALKVKLAVRRRKSLVAAYREITGSDPGALRMPKPNGVPTTY